MQPCAQAKLEQDFPASAQATPQPAAPAEGRTGAEQGQGAGHLGIYVFEGTQHSAFGHAVEVADPKSLERGWEREETAPAVTGDSDLADQVSECVVAVDALGDGGIADS